MLSLRTLRAGLLFAVAGTSIGLSATLFAAAQDYRFEIVGTPTKSEKVTTVKVRLIHIPDGKSVPSAEIVEIRFDMGPDGMAGMTAPAKPATSTEAGIYIVETRPSMAGNWALSLAAKVAGESEIVRGSITVPVPK